MKSPRDIELSCPNITKHDVLDCEVSVQEETTLTVTVTNRSGGDLLNLRCNLLKGTKANVVVHKSQLQPGIHTSPDARILYCIWTIWTCLKNMWKTTNAVVISVFRNLLIQAQ